MGLYLQKNINFADKLVAYIPPIIKEYEGGGGLLGSAKLPQKMKK